MTTEQAMSILSLINVEKYGKERTCLCSELLKDIGDRYFYYIVCQADNQRFLIITEQLFPSESINKPDSTRIEVLRAERSFADCGFCEANTPLRVFWMDYGYFVFSADL